MSNLLNSYIQINQNECKLQKEQRFILNLTRMTEDTKAVLPIHFIEFCVYVHDNNIKELIKIESGYTSVLFNNEELINFGIYNIVVSLEFSIVVRNY